MASFINISVPYHSIVLRQDWESLSQPPISQSGGGDFKYYSQLLYSSYDGIEKVSAIIIQHSY